MKEIKIFSQLGAFADNKDIAQQIRTQEIIPALQNGETVVLDFEKVESATQSLIHALISDLFRIYGSDVLERVSFRNCSETVRKIIEIVVDYMQES
jgi:hypothetical protein